MARQIVKKLFKSLLVAVSALILPVCLGPWALYLYGLQSLPSDKSPAKYSVPPAVLQVVWVSETGTKTMLMESISVWNWITAGSNAFKPSSRVANLAARVLVNREPKVKPQRALTRHVQEMAAAIWVSQHWTAEEAMRTILARSYFGHGFYGLSDAARGYFGISAQDLSVAEAAVVAGLLRAASRYDPWCRPERSRAFAESLITKIQPSTIPPAPRLLPIPTGACK